MNQLLGGIDSALPPEEAVRRHAHRLLRSLPQLDDVVRLAAEVAGTTSGAVNLVHDNGQETVAAWGAHTGSCSIDDSMCRVTVVEGGPVHVADASEDPRFATNPWVTGHLARIRLYCAVPLADPRGTLIGTLCVWDERAQELDEVARRRLQALARHVEGLLAVEAQGTVLDRAVDVLAQHHLELRRSNELLTQFAGQVAHDLKAPMTAVRLTLGVLADLPGIAADPLARPLLERMDGATKRMDSLISGFLALASLEGRTSWAPVDLSELLREVLDDLAVVGARHRVFVGHMPLVRGDAVQLRALLQNLLANAFKYSASAPERIVRIDGGGAAETWWCDVSDSGPGIPPELREVVFEPLVRADTTVEGLGLGLAACRRVAANHNADITILDSPEGGALFRVVATPRLSAVAAAPASVPTA